MSDGLDNGDLDVASEVRKHAPELGPDVAGRGQHVAFDAARLIVDYEDGVTSTLYHFTAGSWTEVSPPAAPRWPAFAVR